MVKAVSTVISIKQTVKSRLVENAGRNCRLTILILISILAGTAVAIVIHLIVRPTVSALPKRTAVPSKKHKGLAERIFKQALNCGSALITGAICQ